MNSFFKQALFIITQTSFFSVFLGCSTHQPKQASEFELFTNNLKPWIQAKKAEKLYPGNQITIEGSEDPQINGKYRVTTEWKLPLAYDVIINVKDKKFSQIVSEIKANYSIFSLNTKMTIRLTSLAGFVDVSGSVKNPAIKLVSSKKNFDDILGFVGGINLNSVDECNNGKVVVEQLGVLNTFPLKFNGERCVIKYKDYLPNIWFGGERINILRNKDSEHSPLCIRLRF